MEKYIFPIHQKKGSANIPAKTAIHANNAATTAAAYASAKNPADVKNHRKVNLATLISGCSWL